MDWLELPEGPYERALTLQNQVLSHATGGILDDALYSMLRTEFMERPETRQLLPRYVRTCRDAEQLWQYLKSVHTGNGAYGVRRQHVYETFAPLLEHLEFSQAAPADAAISETLASFDTAGVHAVWEKALQRRHQDPEGAITAARTLLESVCKCILDEAQENYGPNDDLPKLYARTAKLLKLAPSQHTENAFKAILGGCHTVVQNLGTLRSRIGDAHGQGRKAAKPKSRHAALAVNLAGGMATFLVETWQARFEPK